MRGLGAPWPSYQEQTGRDEIDHFLLLRTPPPQQPPTLEQHTLARRCGDGSNDVFGPLGSPPAGLAAGGGGGGLGGGWASGTAEPAPALRRGPDGRRGTAGSGGSTGRCVQAGARLPRG